MGLRKGEKKVRLQMEVLEDRLTPAVDAFIYFRAGVVAITPPAAQVSHDTVQINRQVAQVALPTGDVIIGHGLKTAEAHTPVVDWTPT